MRAEGPLLLGAFDDHTGFGINLVRPAGVRYFDRDAYEAVNRLCADVGPQGYLSTRPSPNTIDDEVGSALDIVPGRIAVQIGIQYPAVTKGPLHLDSHFKWLQLILPVLLHPKTSKGSRASGASVSAMSSNTGGPDDRDLVCTMPTQRI